MPAALSYPGVYIEEIESGVHAITGVATSITAFVGRTLQGPVNEPVMVNSYGDFERSFGGLWVESTLPYAVRDFYLNGGSQAVIVRLFSPYFETESDQDAGEDKAKAAAQKAAAAIVTLSATETDPKKLSAAAVPDAGATAAEKAAVAAVAAAAKDKADHGGTVPQVISAANGAVADAADKAVPEIFAKITVKDADDNDWHLEAASPGRWGNALRVRIDHDVAKKADGTADGDLFNLSVRDDGTKTVELFRNVSFQPGHPRRVDRVLEAESALVRAPSLPAKRPKEHPTYPGYDPWGDKKPDPIAPATTVDPSNAKVADADKGSDGNVLTRADFTPDGGAAAKRGLNALDKADLINLLCIPPHGRDTPIEIELINDALAYCEARRAMMLIDPLPEWEEGPTKIQKVITGVEGDVAAGKPGKVGSVSPNGALFFPRLIQADPKQDGREDEFAPCGALAGIFARTDANRGVWKAPAGLEATIRSGRPSVPLTDLENGSLNVLGINCLRSMPGVGPVIWGARTRAGDDRNPNDWKYIPVRRMALFIEESLYRGTQWVVFEPNDEPLWASIRLNVGAFMQRLFQQGAFQGSSPREAYFVRCDKSTTTPDDVNLGIVNILVGFAPLKPAEFVVIKLQQMANIAR